MGTILKKQQDEHVWQNPLQYCKVVSLQLIKINEKKKRMISVRFQGKPFNITVNQVYATTTNAEEAEQIHDNLQDLIELSPKKDIFSSYGLGMQK